MISKYMSIACSPHDRYIDIRIGLFIVNMIHIYNVRIHWRLLVKFSCDSYEILCSWVCLNNLLVILTSSCHNTIEISSLANVCLCQAQLTPEWKSTGWTQRWADLWNNLGFSLASAYVLHHLSATWSQLQILGRSPR